MPNWVRKWAGGRVKQDRTGREVWVIERTILGTPYTITLDAASEREALADLALFERDPAGFLTRSQAAAESAAGVVVINNDRIGRFLKHLEEADRSRNYRRNVLTYLRWWRDVLKGRDLRAMRLVQLNDALDADPAGRKHKIIHLKSFASWLRKRGDLMAHQDPTLSLEIPKSRPEKADRKKHHSAEEVERIYRMIASQSIRDAIRIRAMTGMHYSELARLASGRGTVNEVRNHGEIAGTITFRHKNGRNHVISIDAPTLAAVKRLQAAGHAPSDSWMGKVIRAAAKANGVEPLELGALRHSFASWRTSARVVKPKDGGASLAQVAAVMGHLNPRTTAIFYDGTEVPEMVLPPLNLFHPDDPVDVGAKRAREEGNPLAVAVWTRGNRG